MAIDLSRSREFSDGFIDWVRGKGRPLIIAHDNPDPDSLAAATALKHLILLKTGQEAVIAFGGVIGRGENRQMVKELGIKAVPIHSLDINQFNVVCMVDTQPATGNNSYPAQLPVHLVIDHHPPRLSSRECRWADVREDYGAAATILFEYLLAQRVSINTRLATMLFYAIKSETQDLGREWCRADREAYLHLLPLVNNQILFNITHSKLPQGYFHYFCRAIGNSRQCDGVLVFNLYDIDNPDLVAEMADFLLRAENVDVVLGLGRFQQDMVLSFRTLSQQINAADVMQAVVSGLGTAGGHGMMAGGQIPAAGFTLRDQRDLEVRLRTTLLDFLGRAQEPVLPLDALAAPAQDI